jgi:hypothetical protein
LWPEKSKGRAFVNRDIGFIALDVVPAIPFSPEQARQNLLAKGRNDFFGGFRTGRVLLSGNQVSITARQTPTTGVDADSSRYGAGRPDFQKAVPQRSAPSGVPAYREMGASAIERLKTLCRWAEAHAEEGDRARREFDARKNKVP